MQKERLSEILEQRKEEFFSLSREIWSHPELSLSEYHAAEVYVDLLRAEGFRVETGLSGIRTAFSGTYGSGKPVIGILGEFDALDGLSQESGSFVKKPLVRGGCGHGCGHNLLGAAAFAAAVAVKEYLKEKRSGTVVFYGCPGEEGGAAKAFMSRDGHFRKLDAVLAWHPEDVNEIVSGSCMASLQAEYKFDGRASHAASAPQMGRSGLDAAELMNLGTQFLREHLAPGDMVHYAFTNAGGISPNVVPSEARVLYMVRSNTVRGAKEVLRRVENIAKGAAMMTETTLTRRFIDGTSDTLPNHTLERVLWKNFSEAQLPEYTPEEWSIAEKIRETWDRGGVPGSCCQSDPDTLAFVRKASEDGRRALNDFLIPYTPSAITCPGSTDVGDVSHLTPTAQIHTACFPSGIPGHSWQIVSLGVGSIAHKGMLLAAKVLAASAYDLYEDPSLLKMARTEFEAVSGEYLCPIEDGTVPTLPGSDF